MTKRTLERRLSELESDTGTNSIREWIEESMIEDFNYRVEYGETDHSGEVCVLEDGQVTYYVDESEVPSWIDVDTDLPVR